MMVGTKVMCPISFLLLNVALGHVSFLTHQIATLSSSITNITSVLQSSHVFNTPGVQNGECCVCRY